MEIYHFVFSEITTGHFKATKGVNVTKNSLEEALEAFREVYSKEKYKIEAIRLMTF